MINKVKKDGREKNPAETFKYIPGGLWKFCVPIDAVKLYEKNPRRNDAAVAALAEGIKKNLFRKPLVIDQDNVIRAGNTAYKAAVRLGMKMIPVAQSEFTSEADAVEYVISDNRLGENSAWDTDVLKELMVAHKLVDEGGIAAVAGFTEKDVRALFDIKKEAEKVLRHAMEVAVSCANESEARKLYDRLTAEGFKCRVLTM